MKNKIKIISVYLFIALLFLVTITFIIIKNKEEFRQKTVLAQETKKAVEYLMFDLRKARKDTIIDVPPDGLWHHRIAFIKARQEALEYIIKDGSLFRINGGKKALIADNIGDLRIRRQKATPDILEVQIEARKDVSLVSNLKIRIQ